MAASVVKCQLLEWKGTRDADGHREWTTTHLVVFSAPVGPSAAMRAVDNVVPVGTSYTAFVSANTPYNVTATDEIDDWAFCRQQKTCSPRETGGNQTRTWEVQSTFSTKGDDKRCKDEQIDDPLLVPPEITGSFVKYTEEATYDRYGCPIVTSSHEPIRGKEVEFDANRPQIKITMNVADLQLDVLNQMVDTVNAYALWGFPPRTIKLSDVSWERRFYGQCYVYYVWHLTFDIKYRRGILMSTEGHTGTGTGPIVHVGKYETWDRDLLDEGTKVLNGHWSKTTGAWINDNINGSPPDPNNPRHFKRFTDRDGNTTKVILDGYGNPADVHIGTGSFIEPGTGTWTQESECPAGLGLTNAGRRHVEKYDESDFLYLAIPTSF